MSGEKKPKPKTNTERFLRHILERTEENYEKKNHYNGFSTGLSDIDDLTDGVGPQTLWVVTGRPAMGKTAFISGLVSHAVLREKKKIAVFTADHSAKDFLSRLVAAESGISYRSLRDGFIKETEWVKLINVGAAFAEADAIDFFEDTWISVQKVRDVVEKGQYDLLVIDKFHSLILRDEAAEGSNNRTNELNQSVIELKGIAKANDTAVVVLCDINKGQEQRVDPRPFLIDLKDFGGVLESYADVVLALYTPGSYEPWNKEVRGKTEVIPLKNRFGPRWTATLHFDEHLMKFSPIQETESASDLQRPQPTT